jgi:methylenetetrahydrofolate reductase (NADPH)
MSVVNHNQAQSGAIRFSVEIFPPTEAQVRARLADRLETLSPIALEYVSVTYGAGGTTRERTIEMVERIAHDTSIEVAAHLTCVGASCHDVDLMVENYAKAGVGRIVALRGDPPGGLDVPYQPHPQGYQNTADLVARIAARGHFDISVAAYPEKHPQSRNVAVDLDTLKAKVDAGANGVLTQFFFDNQRFLRFFDRARAHGISVPVVPGILPVVNFKQVHAFATKCGTTMPEALVAQFDGLEDNLAARIEIGADFAASQIVELVREGHTSFHIYCLNRPEIVRHVWDRVHARLPGIAAA